MSNEKPIITATNIRPSQGVIAPLLPKNNAPMSPMFLHVPLTILVLFPKTLKVLQLFPSFLKYWFKLYFICIITYKYETINCIYKYIIQIGFRRKSSDFYESRKENPQKLTQLSSRSYPRHLVGKRTAQKDITIDTTSDSQVNSNFPNRWSPASLTFNNYFLPIFIFIYNVNNHK